MLTQKNGEVWVRDRFLAFVGTLPGQECARQAELRYLELRTVNEDFGYSCCLLHLLIDRGMWSLIPKDVLVDINPALRMLDVRYPQPQRICGVPWIEITDRIKQELRDATEHIVMPGLIGKVTPRKHS